MGKVPSDLNVGREIYLLMSGSYAKQLKNDKYKGKLVKLFIIESRGNVTWHLIAISPKPLFKDKKLYSGHGIKIDTIDNRVLTKSEIRQMSEVEDDQLALKGYKPKSFRKEINKIIPAPKTPKKAAKKSDKKAK